MNGPSCGPTLDSGIKNTSPKCALVRTAARSTTARPISVTFCFTSSLHTVRYERRQLLNKGFDPCPSAMDTNCIDFVKHVDLWPQKEFLDMMGMKKISLQRHLEI